jgi:HSP20 family protein
MQLVRYFRPFSFVFPEVDRSWSPAVDVFERESALVVRAELPGVERQDIHVRVDDRVLVIEGERKREAEIEEGTVHRVERSYGRFVRRFRLADTIDVSKIAAGYKNGILEVKLPKSEAAKPRKIEIRAA